MSTNNHEPKRIPVVGYACEGGFDTDYNTRPFRHASEGRRNWRRQSSKRQRNRDKADIVSRLQETEP